MKLKNFCWALIIFLATAQASWSMLHTFGPFKAEIPLGWTGELQGSTLVIKSKEADASVTVASNTMGQVSLGEIAEVLCLQVDGRDLEQDDDGDYTFNFIDSSGEESIALVTGDEEFYLVVAMTGYENENLQGDFEKILASIDWNFN
ncbi:MAG: hypothetical protein IJR94_07650 [Synergistaceae bacterium]|nr:hypothetical protein [Synergistaceae bacterium]